MKASLLLLLMVAVFQGAAQPNLVLNPSFEDTVHLIPFQNYGAIYPLCRNWKNSSGGSVDYYSGFADELQYQTTNVAYFLTGNNVLSNLLPHSGSGMIGMTSYEDEYTMRENCVGKLSQTMNAGTDYCISFWMRQTEIAGLRNCQFTVGFDSVEKLAPAPPGLLPLAHEIKVNIQDLDSTEWTYFEFVYTAIGGENYIYLGNNQPDIDFDCVYPYNSLSWLWNSSYVLIDDISIRNASFCNSVDIFQDESTNSFLQLRNILSNAHYSNFHFTIYELTGRLLGHFNQSNCLKALSDLPKNNMYIISMYDDANKLTIKLFLNEN